MRDDDAGLVLTGGVDGLLDGVFGFVVERAGSLVKQQNVAVPYQSPSDGKTLTLAA